MYCEGVKRMECYKVKIKKLKIEKLHDYIDYDIEFNNDITFLYGDNGCGKTTILNILTSIITGRVYELSKYQFTSISLKYSSQKLNLLKIITVKKNKDDGDVVLNYNSKDYVIDVQKLRIMNSRLDEINDIEDFYFKEYRVLSDVKNEFNYIYLPLNRNGSINELNFHSNRKMHRLNNLAPYYSDMTLNGVARLVKETYNRINLTLSRINEKFSEELLKSFLDIENISNAHQLVTYANKLNPFEITKIKKDYTYVLKAIKKWDDTTEKKITDFFESLLNDVKESESENGFSIEILFKLSELIKITKVIEKAERIEQSKIRISQPVSNFISAVNKFINMKTTKKEIYIDNEGQIYLKTPYKNKINLQQLSSGEKQIVTFFAYLIFGLQDTNQSLFIVDEPELSLHLQWQRQFVDTLLELNPDIQLIFATHAPEIIGKHRDKAFKLIPNY